MYHKFIYSTGEHDPTREGKLLYLPVEAGGFSNGTDKPTLPDLGTTHFWDRARGSEGGPSDLFHARLYGGRITSSYDDATHYTLAPGETGYFYRYSGYLSMISSAQAADGRWCVLRLVFEPYYDYGVSVWPSLMVFNDALGTTWEAYMSGGYEYHWNAYHSAAILSMDEYHSWLGRPMKELFRIVQPSEGGTIYSGLLDGESLKSVDDGSLTDFQFKHNEYWAYYGQQVLGALPNLYRNGFACAFTEAARQLPFVSSNGIANVAELAAAIVSIANGIKSIGKLNLVQPKAYMSRAIVPSSTLGNKWLFYRYAFKTTKSDIAEYTSLLTRMSNIAKSDHIRVGGGFSREDIFFRCTCEYASSDVIPDDVRAALRQFGLELNSYTAWDLIPYSFVVDWFLNIGDLLEKYEVFERGQKFTPVDTWYSCKTRYMVDSGRQQDVYMRFGGLGTRLGAPCFTDTHQISGKTFAFRVFDGMSLFTPN